MKIAINGFGRIGRAFYKAAAASDGVEVVAINDLGDRENLEYLLKYDSVYGKSLPTTNHKLGTVTWLSEKKPGDLPWGELGVDVVVECTGLFRTLEAVQGHLDAGAKRVVISAPSEDVTTVLAGVNEELLSTTAVSSNASCTTNATSPLVGILSEAIGIEKAILNTVHGYTATQRTVDGPSKKDFRRGRAAAINIIPTTTGAAKATTKAYPELEGKFDGLAMRVPVPVGSIVDITFVARRDTTVEEVNDALKEAESSERWGGVFATTSEPLVSTDILGNPHAAIADLSMTRVVGGNLVKVLSWYDNETGYANSLLRHVLSTSNFNL